MLDFIAFFLFLFLYFSNKYKSLGRVRPCGLVLPWCSFCNTAIKASGFFLFSFFFPKYLFNIIIVLKL